MTQDRIESRRAFMKKLGKLTGSVAVAVPFITMTSNETVAKPNEERPVTICKLDCSISCKESMSGGCGRCQNVCTEGCALSCNSMCGGDCGEACVGACQDSCSASCQRTAKKD